MDDIGIFGLALILANIAISYRGFTNIAFFHAYKFELSSILVHKQYVRLLSSGFLHIDWVHLILNMVTLYAFSGALESYIGSLGFLVIYSFGLIGGGIFALLIHRNHDDYSAVGASGAICGIVFAAIALFPGIEIGFLGLPFYIPGWLYGILYVAYTMYGVRSNRDNIGHEAHLGGAITGMLAALAFKPEALVQNLVTILIITIPTMVFIYVTVTRPYILFIQNHYFNKHSQYQDVDHRYNEAKALKQKELDRILDKINAKGIESLSKAEKRKLEAYSK